MQYYTKHAMVQRDHQWISYRRRHCRDRSTTVTISEVIFFQTCPQLYPISVSSSLDFYVYPTHLDDSVPHPVSAIHHHLRRILHPAQPDND